MSHIAAFE